MFINFGNRQLRMKCFTWSKVRLPGISFFGGKAGGAVARIPERLSDLAETLKEICYKVEADFLQLGNALQMIHSKASELTELTRHTVKSISAESEDNLLAKIHGLAQESLTGIEGYQSTISDKLEHLDGIPGFLARLDGICAEIDKAGKFMKVVGVNMGIECARTAAAKEMFETVARDIQEIAVNVFDVVNSIRDHAGTALEHQIQANSDVSTGLSTLTKVSAEARLNLEDALVRIDQLMGLSSATLENAGRHSRRISDRIGEVVVAIQFQDSMRQRVDHIADTLHQAETLCESKISADESADAEDEKWVRAYRLIDVQIAQLVDIIRNVNTVDEKSTKAFGEIIREVEGLEGSFSEFGLGWDRSGSSAPEPNTGERSVSETDRQFIQVSNDGGADPFSALNSALRRLQDLFSKGGTLIERMSDIATHASDTAAGMSGHAEHVRNISLKTHRLSLNAIIMSEKIGTDGKTLEVMAQEVSRLSRKTNGMMTDVRDLLDSVTGTTKNIQSDTMFQEKKTSVRNRLIHESLDTVIAETSDAYTLLRENACAASRCSDTLKSLISETRAGLDFLPKLSDRFTGHLRQLEEIIRIPGVWKKSVKKLERDEADDFIAQYTMEKEREILNRTLCRDKEKRPVPPEMYDTQVMEIYNSTAENAVPPVGNGSDPEGSSELFGKPLNASTECKDTMAMSAGTEKTFPGDAKGYEDDLGDNVELF